MIKYNSKKTPVCQVFFLMKINFIYTVSVPVSVKITYLITKQEMGDDKYERYRCFSISGKN